MKKIKYLIGIITLIYNTEHAIKLMFAAVVTVLTMTLLMPVVADANLTGKIVFVSTRDGNNEIYVMDADGSNQTRLTNNLYSDSSPSWSPDGSQIAFFTNRDGNWEIYVMDADGSNQTNLTNSPLCDQYPDWSPDGEKIVFAASESCNPHGYYTEVYVMEADGSNRTQLTDNGKYVQDNFPRWTPDGRITFDKGWSNGREIWIMDADGSNQTRLTYNGYPDNLSDMSPDGSQIAFVRNNWIYLMNADGSSQTRLTYPGWRPDWSPDGSQIVFDTNRDGNLEIYVMDVDGTNLINLTSHTGNDFHPRWLPEAENQPPVADAGGDYETSTSAVIADIDPNTFNINSKGKWVTAYLVTDPDGLALVQLDGTSSYDDDEDELSFSWTVLDSDNNVINTTTGEQPVLSLPIGEFDVELIVNDGKEDSAPATAYISILPLDIDTVNASEITLQGPGVTGFPVFGDWAEMQDHETLMVKFGWQDLIDSLIPGEENVIQVGGAVTGEDTIMVINRGGGKGNK